MEKSDKVKALAIKGSVFAWLELHFNAFPIMTLWPVKRWEGRVVFSQKKKDIDLSSMKES